MNYGKHFNTRATPQSQPIPGSGQVPNEAGGYAWPVDDWTRLDRFLVLGTEGGTYYVGEAQLTRENAEAVARCISADGPRVVALIVEVSEAGRVPKNDPALFALAMCAGLGSSETRKAALEALPRVARIGTHLFHFLEYAQGFRGWGVGMRRAVGAWYGAREAKDLALQLVKYPSRDGWSHRDALRLAHPAPADETRKALYHYATRGWPGVGAEPHPDETLRVVWAAERAKAAELPELLALIREHRLPREAIPTERLRERVVWAALLERMPMEAMARNLATMTRVGLLAPLSPAVETVAARLRDPEAVRRSRLHPVKLLAALTTYESGRGVRGQGEWEPVPQVVDALGDAFHLAFGNVEPTGRRVLLAVDVSGSMQSEMVAGVPGLSARAAAGAMALVVAATEPRRALVAFHEQATSLDVSPRMRLPDVVRRIDAMLGGGTDCAAPISWALERKVEADAFVILTDSETWAGRMHPAQAIQSYRKATGIPAKLVVVAMAANSISIADPEDAGQFNAIGFDGALPQLINDFIR